MRYIALLDGGPGAYGVSIPDCPGCTAMGATQDEALANARDALAEWAIDMGADIPAPRALDDLRADADVAATLAEGAAFVVVPLVIERARAVKANISLDAGMLEAIDEAAVVLGLTRSSFIAAAAREKIGRTY
jgi:predicted RNase H-like HicB family nuclease